MKKIVITNAYTWDNKGDAGILLGIIEALKKVYNNDVEFNVLSFTPDKDKTKYCVDKSIKNVYSNILNPRPYKHTKIGKLCAIIKLFFKMVYLQFMLKFSKEKLISKNETFRIMNDSDIIVVCGGGFLGGKKFDSLMHLFQIYANTKFDKPVIVMGTSIEPIESTFIKKSTENILKRVDFIYARETITYEYLKTFLNEDKFTLIPDMAFMLRDVKEKNKIVELKNEKNLLIGITVRKWNFPNSINPAQSMENYINSVTSCMESIIEEKNATFVFIPQVIVEYGNDVDIAKKIKEKINDRLKDNVIIIEDDLSPTELKTLIWNLDYFVGTRMHSNIFATSMGIPTVAIAYEKKTNGIMETVGLQDYVVEINDISQEKLINKILLLIENGNSIRNLLNEKIKNIRKEIIEKLEKMKEF